MMIYSNFRGVTGKHGPSMTRKMAMALKERMSRLRRKQRRVTTPPRYTGVYHNKRSVRNRFSSHSWR